MGLSKEDIFEKLDRLADYDHEQDRRRQITKHFDDRRRKVPANFVRNVTFQEFRSRRIDRLQDEQRERSFVKYQVRQDMKAEPNRAS